MGDVGGLKHSLHLAVANELGFKSLAFLTGKRGECHCVAAAAVLRKVIGGLPGIVDSGTLDEAFYKGKVFGRFIGGVFCGS